MPFGRSSRGPASIYAREDRNTITTNNAIAATTIRDPRIGAASNEGPFRSTTATPIGNEDATFFALAVAWADALQRASAAQGSGRDSTAEAETLTQVILALYDAVRDRQASLAED